MVDGDVHINWVKTSRRWLKLEKCLDCKKESFFLNFMQTWYGMDSTCLNCGRHWCDGEWMDLDFYRYARRNNIEGAINRWKRGIEKDD